MLAELKAGDIADRRGQIGCGLGVLVDRAANLRAIDFYCMLPRVAGAVSEPHLIRAGGNARRGEGKWSGRAVALRNSTYTFGPPPTLNFEAESMSPVGTGATVSISNDANASGGVVEFLNATAASQTITFTTPSIPAGTYQVQLRYRSNTTRGQPTVKIDGTQVGGTIDQYAKTAAYPTATIGNVTFSSAGTHKIVMTVTGKNSAATQFYITADKFTFVGQ